MAAFTPALGLTTQQAGDHEREHQQAGGNDRPGQCCSHITDGNEDRQQRAADKQQRGNMPEAAQGADHFHRRTGIATLFVGTVANQVANRPLELKHKTRRQQGRQHVGKH